MRRVYDFIQPSHRPTCVGFLGSGQEDVKKLIN